MFLSNVYTRVTVNRENLTVTLNAFLSQLFQIKIENHALDSTNSD
jgi:hypothetical protein